VVRLHDQVGAIDFGDGQAQPIQNLFLLGAQQRPFPTEPQVRVAFRCPCLAKTDRQRIFQARLPLVEIAAGQVLIGVVEPAPVAVDVEQIAAKAADTITPEHVQLREQKVAGGGQFQFRAIHHQPLASEFTPATERLGGDRRPIEHDVRRRRFVDRQDQPVGIGRNVHDQPQTSLVDQHAGQAAERTCAPARSPPAPLTSARIRAIITPL